MNFYYEIKFPFFHNSGDPDEAIDGPDSGYDIVVDDETVGSELVNNQYGHDNPQIHQVQHIAHVQNLQQFSPAYPVQPLYQPNVHNHGQPLPIYFKQNNVPAEKSATGGTETVNKTADTKPIENKTEQAEKMKKTEQQEKLEKIEPTKLPAPMNEILGVNTTAKI